MRWLIAALLCAGCLQQLVPEHKSATQTKETPDLLEPAQNPAPQDPQNPQNPQTPADDMASSMMSPGDGGSAMTGADGGTTSATPLAFGSPCAVAADCQSGHCEQVNGGLFCTVPCTMLNAVDPACPNNGMCNMKGFCKP